MKTTDNNALCSRGSHSRNETKVLLLTCTISKTWFCLVSFSNGDRGIMEAPPFLGQIPGGPLP